MDKVTKKPKIKIDPRLHHFDEETPFLEKLKYKYLTLYFMKKFFWAVFRLVFLIGISYVILLPYISKISGSFMSRDDFVDVMVKLIPRYPTLDTYKAIINENEYFRALGTTAVMSVVAGLLQMSVCAIVGYGLSKFKFKGRNILFVAVVFMMIVPHETLSMSLYMKFRFFDIWGLYGMIAKAFNLSKDMTPAIGNLLNTDWPLVIMSATGIAFKNGLFIFIMRQYYKGVPDELEEAAYVDGAGVLKTFIRIIVPMSAAMLVTIFMFAFSWQWTDQFYGEIFYTNKDFRWLFPDVVKIPSSINVEYSGKVAYQIAINNTAGLLILTPLLIIFLFAQRTLIEGVERSGITG